MAEITAQRGRQFDPRVVEALCELVESGALEARPRSGSASA